MPNRRAKAYESDGLRYLPRTVTLPGEEDWADMTKASCPLVLANGTNDDKMEANFVCPGQGGPIPRLACC